MEPQINNKTAFLKGFLKETGKLALIIVFVIIPFRLYIAQPFMVSGASMEPTFDNKDYLIVDQISFKIKGLNRQDVVIFRPPTTENTYFIKRVIGFPGETVSINKGVVSITKTDGEIITLDEQYILFTKKDDNLNVTLKDNEYFVMGDNRAGSFDSRSWGPLTSDRIVGRPLVRLFPASEFRIWPGTELNK